MLLTTQETTLIKNPSKTIKSSSISKKINGMKNSPQLSFLAEGTNQDMKKLEQEGIKPSTALKLMNIESKTYCSTPTVKDFEEDLYMSGEHKFPQEEENKFSKFFNKGNNLEILSSEGTSELKIKEGKKEIVASFFSSEHSESACEQLKPCQSDSSSDSGMYEGGMNEERDILTREGIGYFNESFESLFPFNHIKPCREKLKEKRNLTSSVFMTEESIDAHISTRRGEIVRNRRRSCVQRSTNPNYPSSLVL